MPNFSITNYEGQQKEVKLVALKFYQWALDKHLSSLRIVIADGLYYSKTLQQRRDILSAPSTSFLCKTIVFENTAYNEKFAGEYYPKYLAVMVQYISKINTEKLNKQVKLMQNANSSQKAGKQYFHYRLVEDAESQAMTGYQHNGVVPVMMKTTMPIIFSHQIEKLTPQFFWMGGGHPWIKIRCSLDQFKKASDGPVYVLDVTY